MFMVVTVEVHPLCCGYNTRTTRKPALCCGLAQVEDRGLQEQERHCSVKVACAHGRGHRRCSSYQPRHPYRTSTSMPPITDGPINNSNLGGSDPAFPPFVEHSSLTGGSAASAQSSQCAQRTSKWSRPASHHIHNPKDHSARSYKVYEASTYTQSVRVDTVTSWSNPEHWLQPQNQRADNQCRTHTPPQKLGITFQILSSIVIFNARSCPIRSFEYLVEMLDIMSASQIVPFDGHQADKESSTDMDLCRLFAKLVLISNSLSTITKI